MRVDRDVTDRHGKTEQHDTRCFLTSLDPGKVSGEQLLATVRAHWQIENSLHFVKYRWWDEDRHHTRRPGLSDWLAQLTTAATGILRILVLATEPLRARADRIA